MSEVIVEKFLIGVNHSIEGYSSLGEAVHFFLRRENKGKIIDWVEECSEVTVKEVYLDSIYMGSPHHFKKIEAREPAAPIVDTPVIAGVLVVRKGFLKLVDGYHRYKFLEEENVDHASYIILSKDVFEKSVFSLRDEIRERNKVLWEE